MVKFNTIRIDAYWTINNAKGNHYRIRSIMQFLVVATTLQKTIIQWHFICTVWNDDLVHQICMMYHTQDAIAHGSSKCQTRGRVDIRIISKEE